jgi:hypothetical protein
MDYPTLYDVCGIMDPYETVAIVRNRELLYQGSPRDVVQGQATDFDGEIISDSIVYELEVRHSDILLRID